MQKGTSHPQWTGIELVICNAKKQRTKERHLQIIKKKRNATQKFYNHSTVRPKRYSTYVKNRRAYHPFILSKDNSWEKYYNQARKEREQKFNMKEEVKRKGDQTLFLHKSKWLRIDYENV